MAVKFGRTTDKKRVGRFKKKMRIRRRLSGSEERPRLSVFKSLKHVYAQLIDDAQGATLVSASSNEEKLKGKSGKEAAKVVGKELASRALAKKISQAVFDRNGYKFHGKIKELAEAAREAGLKF